MPPRSPPRTIPSSHRWFLAMLAVGFVVVLALVDVTFLRFPTSRVSSGTGPKANIPIWLGPDGAGLFYLGLGGVYAGLYLWVGSQSARSARCWRPGAFCGLALGSIWLVVSVVANWLPALGALRPLGLLAFLGLPVVAGMLGARATGLARDGALAGFWCGVVAAVFLAASIIGVDNAFAATLVHTSWAHDPTCPQPAGPALAGCEIGDDLGLVAVELTLLPVLVAGIGAIGGAIGAPAAMAMSPQTPPPKDIPAGGTCINGHSGWSGPLIFSCIMLVLFLAEIALNLV